MPIELFISGKNWKLSLAELISYLKAREIKFEMQFFSKEFFAVSVEEGFGVSVIKDLGGTIKIGEAKVKFPTLIAKEAFLERSKQAQLRIAASLASSDIVEDMSKSAEKVLFGVSVYCAEKTLRSLSGVIQRFAGSAVKGQLADIDKKSKFMGFSKDRRFAQLSHVEVLKKNLVENKAEVLLCIGKEETWVATTVAVHNPFEFQKRDMYKPNQRKIFAIPPRLARIMVNLSACTPGKVLLDPFCGVGTILQEALLARAKVVGIDVNPWCVKAANENLEWIKREYNLEDTEFRVVQGNVGRLAEKIGQETVDCVVTEPDLGPALRQVPTGPYALKIIQKLEPLYFTFVEEAHRVLQKGGRLVLVTPYIITRSGQSVTMPIGEKLENLGFRRIQPFSKEMFSKDGRGLEELVSVSSLAEIDERHKICREIHIYQK
ncbi:MAG: methyltransferase domain-containing protein [Candidatus Bathyarchaeia archaeon]|jgi:tRNA G10  N-methylase Trm11